MVVKKYAVFAMAAGMLAGPATGGKKSRAVSRIATVGPAARKLHMNMARQMSVAM